MRRYQSRHPRGDASTEAGDILDHMMGYDEFRAGMLKMVRDLPPFLAIAGEISKILEGCDLVGYNVEEYDLPILKREFVDAGIYDFGKDAKVVDVKVIFNKKVQRDLSSAVRHYLDRPHENAHNALADAQATADVLLRQLAVHDLPSDANALQAYCHERDTDDWS